MLNAIAKLILFFVIVVSFSSCASTELTWKNVNEDWNPPQGLDYARAQCKAKMDSAYTINPFAVMDLKGKVYRSCMAAYGYEIDRSK